MTITTTAPEPRWSPVVLRLATAGDQRSLELLAQLDSQPTPVGTTLMAELSGRPVAALSLDDGHEIADPFVASAEIRALLRLRAAQLNQAAEDRGQPVRPASEPVRPASRPVRPRFLKSAPSARCAPQPLSSS